MTFHHERRLDRALYHLDSLETEVDAWLDKGPHRTWTETDVNGTYKYFWVEVLEQPPAELGLVVGDCLHNLRSALDNLVLELAIARNKGRPVSSSIESDSGFPIFLTENPEKFDNMLRGIKPRAKAEIEGLQPYNRGDRFATGDPLWQLNKLCNIDKHRLPHVVTMAFASIGYFVPDSIGTTEVEPIQFTVEDRAPIARYPAVDDTGAGVNVEFTPSFDVGFGQRAPKNMRGTSVPDALKRMHIHITREVLPALKDFLA